MRFYIYYNKVILNQMYLFRLSLCNSLLNNNTRNLINQSVFAITKKTALGNYEENLLKFYTDYDIT